MKSLYARFRMPKAHDRGTSPRGSTARMIATSAVALTAVLVGPGAIFAQDSDFGAVPKGPQVAALYELQAAFHRASTVRNPVSGDPDYVIQQRIEAVLSLWTAEGWILFQTGGPRDGYYIGRGDPASPSTCPAPSGSFANRGTLCTFFKYVAAPFQAANRFVSLAPTYKTSIGVSGDNATVYFECHFFNVAPDSTTGKPLWTATGHLAVDATAAKVERQWLFSSMSVQPAGVPLPQ